jgi:biopolymer transport protein ExbD
MAISSRQAGATVECPTCGEPTQVPLEDEFNIHVSRDVTRPEIETFPEPLDSDQSQSMSDEPLDSDDSRTLSDKDVPEIPLQALPKSTRESAQKSVDEESADEQESSDELFVPGEIGGDDGDGPLTLRRHRNLDEEMDLTPMVDVTFQLLIFFMVSASFSLQKSIEVPTPDPDQKGASQQVQTLDDLQGTSIIVKIDSSNTVFIDDEPVADVLRLSDTLRDKMRREQKTELLLTADNQSLHRSIIAVIDAANEVGMQKIRMTSRKKAD